MIDRCVSVTETETEKVYLADFLRNQPNEICSHLSEKASKGTFLKPEKLQDHSNELRKRKEKKKERREGKEEKKNKPWFHS